LDLTDSVKQTTAKYCLWRG